MGERPGAVPAFLLSCRHRSRSRRLRFHPITLAADDPGPGAPPETTSPLLVHAESHLIARDDRWPLVLSLRECPSCPECCDDHNRQHQSNRPLHRRSPSGGLDDTRVWTAWGKVVVVAEDDQV